MSVNVDYSFVTPNWTTANKMGHGSVSYTHLRAHETGRNLVCRLLLEKKPSYLLVGIYLNSGSIISSATSSSASYPMLSKLKSRQNCRDGSKSKSIVSEKELSFGLANWLVLWFWLNLSSYFLWVKLVSYAAKLTPKLVSHINIPNSTHAPFY